MQYEKGQRVSTWDDDENRRVKGIVVQVLEKSIFVKWEDLHDPVEHSSDEYKDIRIERQ